MRTCLYMHVVRTKSTLFVQTPTLFVQSGHSSCKMFTLFVQSFEQRKKKIGKLILTQKPFLCYPSPQMPLGYFQQTLQDTCPRSCFKYRYILINFVKISDFWKGKPCELSDRFMSRHVFVQNFPALGWGKFVDKLCCTYCVKCELNTLFFACRNIKKTTETF